MSKFTRLAFLKKLLGTGLLVSVPTMAVVGSKKKSTPTKPVFVLKAYLRGMRYYNAPQCVGNIKRYDSLDLVREPNNKHDKYAVAVYWKRKKLGYLPREDNKVVANLLDSGMPLKCTVKALRPDVSLWEGCLVEVSGLMTDEHFLEEQLLMTG